MSGMMHLYVSKKNLRKLSELIATLIFKEVNLFYFKKKYIH